MTSERYFGVNSSLGTSEVPSSMSTASYIRPPMTMQGGKRNKRQQGGGDGGYTGTERYFGINTQHQAGPSPPSSMATTQYIRPPLVQQGGFSPAIMGTFADTAARILPFAVAATAYKTYKSYINSRKHSKRTRRTRR